MPSHSILDSLTHSAGDGSAAILVPDARLLFGGDFKQSGVDLILSKDGHDFTIHDYFKGSRHADLRSPDGAILSADVIDALSAHTQYAQASGAADAGKVIGQVTKLTGSAIAVRNGVTVELHVGDNVLKGDVVQAGAGAALVMTFIDGTVFGLSSNARMVLNEMVYDPNGSSNTSLLSLVQGTVTFVAGETARHGDMKVDTPVATMGIRGTAGLIEMGFEVTQSNAPPVRFEILLERGNVVGSYLLLSKTDPNVIYGTVDRRGIATYLDGSGHLTQTGSPPLTDAAKQIIIDTLSTYFPNYIPDLNNSNPKSGPGSSGSPPYGQPSDGLAPIPQFFPLDQPIKVPVPISLPGAGNQDQAPVFITLTVHSSAPTVTAASFAVSGGQTTVLSPSTFLATDPKNDTVFTFVLSNVTNGTFQVTSDGVHWTDTTTVTTQQLNLGEVRFVPDGTGLPPTFSIQALNGDTTDNASAVVAGNVLLLTVSNPTVSVVTGPAVNVTQGDTVLLNVLAVESNQNVPSVMISGAPSGAVLSDGHGHSATSDGSTPINVAGWNLSTLAVTPTSDVNFTLTVTATDGNISASATEQVTVNPAAPTVTWAAATPAVEGSTIALGNLAATVTSHAGDTNTLNTLTISGAPFGTVLSDGHGHSATSNGSTPIDVVGWNLSTLTITPTGDHNFTLTATATEKDADGDISTTATATELVTVNPTAPTLTWAAATPGVEGTPIALGALSVAISETLTNQVTVNSLGALTFTLVTTSGLVGDNNTLNTLTISGAPSGAVLSDGHGHSVTSDGSTPIDVAGWTLSTLAITPSGDGNFTLTATATVKDADGDVSAATTATEQVIVNPTAPTVTWAAATPGVEGTAIALGTLATTITGHAGDTNTLNTLTISGAPAGAVLSDGHTHSVTSDGSTPIDVAGWNLSTLTITPTGDGNFTLTATATEKDANGDISTAATATEQVTAAPTAPTVTWAAATPGVEGTPIALGTLAATITSHDGDANTLDTLTISGAPAGAVLSDGHTHSVTSDGSTPIDVAGWNLSTLTITPTGDSNFTLTATATEKDSNGDVSTAATATEQVIVTPTAPTVTWAAATPGVEGTPIALGTLAATITSQAGDTNTLNTLTISGAPAGAVLSDGHTHSVISDGSTPIDVVGWSLSTLSITPTSDVDFTLTATATEKDANGDISTAATATEQVTAAPTAPTVTWAAATPGVEGTPIALGTLAATITSHAGDANTLNTLTISGAPAGAVLSDGHTHSVTSDGSTPISVVGWNLSTLTITPTGDGNFTLTATATEKDANGDISTATTATEQVTVNPTAPTVTWAAATPGVEGTAIALGTLAATITSHAGDTNTLNTLTISGAPAGAVLSDGHTHSVTSDGSTPISVVGWNLSTLTITPTGDGNFTLTATATEKDSNGDVSTAATATEQVIVTPTAPTVTTAPVSGIEDGPIALAISALANGLPGDGNVLQSLIISAIPVGAVLSDGSHSFTATSSTTSVDVLGWTLTSLTINTANAQGGDEANVTLQVTATEKDADGNTSSTTASENVTVTPEAPSISASPAAGVDGSPIALHISASGDERGDSLASLVIGAIPVGDTLSDGNGNSFTASAGHTSVDVHAWHLSSLTITPTSSGDFTLTVTATVKDFEGDVGPSATTTAHVVVADDPPTITGTTATGSVPAGLLTTTAATYLTDSHNLVNGLGGTSGFGTSIGRNDDGSSPSLDITAVFGAAGLNFFGHTYTQVWVNNNGNITFTGPNGTYTPDTITAGSNPIIAPFWADVDTRGGAVSPSPGGNSTGSNLVYYSLDATNHVLTVTWDDVGYYGTHTNPVDAFQLQLIGLGNGDFDIVFRYESIDWTTGDASGGHNGLGGSVARVGYSAGDGNPAHYFELAGSGNQTSMLNLDSTTGNTGIAGVDVFQVTSGAVTNAPIASGTVSFADPDDTAHTASFQPDGAGYKGSFTLDPVSESNNAGSVAWHFSLTTTEINAITTGAPLVQSYDITINDGHPGGQVTQTVSVMVGSAGNDTLTANHGVDVMIGGGGNDTFVFNAHIGQQTIVDFQSGADKVDITQISGVTAENLASWLNGGNGLVAHATQVGNDTLIDLDQTPHGTDTILVKNIAPANLHVGDFIVHA